MNTNNSLKRLFIYLLAVVLISCADSSQNSQEKHNESDNSAVEQKLKEANLKIDKAVLEGDFETILKYYSDSVVVVPVFKPVLKGKEAVRQAYMQEQKDGVKFHAFNASIEKIWEAGNNVYEYGSFGMTVTSNQTKHPYGFTGNYFMIWEKQKDQSYLIKYMISNLDFNPCENFY